MQAIDLLTQIVRSDRLTHALSGKIFVQRDRAGRHASATAYTGVRSRCRRSAGGPFDQSVFCSQGASAPRVIVAAGAVAPYAEIAHIDPHCDRQQAESHPFAGAARPLPCMPGIHSHGQRLKQCERYQKQSDDAASRFQGPTPVSDIAPFPASVHSSSARCAGSTAAALAWLTSITKLRRWPCVFIT